MPDVVALGSLAVSTAALIVAYRSAARSERDRRERQLDRAARPDLGLEIRPSNVVPDDDGVICTEATTIYVNLAITLTNHGTKPAGTTQVDAWVPAFVDSMTLKWMDTAGREARFGTSTPDPTTQVDAGDGHQLDTQRMARTLDAVPLMGETVLLRMACPVAVGGDAVIPVRVRAAADGSEADITYPIRLQHAKALAFARVRAARIPQNDEKPPALDASEREGEAGG